MGDRSLKSNPLQEPTHTYQLVFFRLNGEQTNGSHPTLLNLNIYICVCVCVCVCVCEREREREREI